MAKFGHRRVATGQVVIRNSAVEMMDMVETNIARKPLEDCWQFIVRATLERRAANSQRS